DLRLAPGWRRAAAGRPHARPHRRPPQGVRLPDVVIAAREWRRAWHGAARTRVRMRRMKTYLVGGAVRDELLGLAPGDRDWVVVGATPQRMLDAGFRPVGRD